MKIINSTFRAVIERVTEMVYDQYRIFVFEYIDEKGHPHNMRIQNWACDNVTYEFKSADLDEIKKMLKEYYKSEATK